eukprot:m51a1_g8295 hypothetical protein (698) ;mRNA; f:169791-172666
MDTKKRFLTLGRNVGRRMASLLDVTAAATTTTADTQTQTRTASIVVTAPTGDPAQQSQQSQQQQQRGAPSKAFIQLQAALAAPPPSDAVLALASPRLTLTPSPSASRSHLCPATRSRSGSDATLLGAPSADVALRGRQGWQQQRIVASSSSPVVFVARPENPKSDGSGSSSSARVASTAELVERKNRDLALMASMKRRAESETARALDDLATATQTISTLQSQVDELKHENERLSKRAEAAEAAAQRLPPLTISASHTPPPQSPTGAGEAPSTPASVMGMLRQTADATKRLFTPSRRAAVAAVPSDSPPSSPSSPSLGTLTPGGDAAALRLALAACRRQLRELQGEYQRADVLLTVFYKASGVSIDESGQPAPCALLFRFLVDAHSLEVPDGELFDTVTDAFSDAVKRSKCDGRMLMFWFSTAYHLCREVNQSCYALTDSRRRPAVTTVAPQPPQASRPRAAGSAEPIEAFDQNLLGSVFDLYCTVLERLYTLMDRAMEELASPVDETRERGLREMTTLMTEAFKDAHESAVPTLPCQQLFCQLFSYITASLVNALATTPSLCNATSAFRMKQAVSRMEDWLSSISMLAQARDFLQPINDALNLIVLDKSVVLHDLAAGCRPSAAFPALSCYQMLALLRNFEPDALAPSDVGPEVLRRVQEVCDSAANSSGVAGSATTDPYALIPLGSASAIADCRL